MNEWKDKRSPRDVHSNHNHLHNHQVKRKLLSVKSLRQLVRWLGRAIPRENFMKTFFYLCLHKTERCWLYNLVLALVFNIIRSPVDSNKRELLRQIVRLVGKRKFLSSRRWSRKFRVALGAKKTVFAKCTKLEQWQGGGSGFPSTDWLCNHRSASTASENKPSRYKSLTLNVSLLVLLSYKISLIFFCSIHLKHNRSTLQTCFRIN